MIDFMKALPGHLVAVATGHPYLTTLGVLIVVAVGYCALLKLKFASDDRRDERAARSKYLR
jgi:hypothetical protein